MSLLRKLSAYLIFESDFPDLGFLRLLLDEFANEQMFMVLNMMNQLEFM